MVTWYTTDEKFPELGDEIVYIDKADKQMKEMVYQTDWINKHKNSIYRRGNGRRYWVQSSGWASRRTV